MSNKKKNKALADATAQKKSGERNTEKPKEERKLSKTSIVVASISAVLVLTFVVSLIVAAVLNSQKNPTDFMNDDLSKYVYISEEDYKGFKVNISLSDVRDVDVERKILALLYAMRGKDSVYGEGYIKNIPITAGDTAYIYYRGYTVDENGKEIELERSSNFFDYKTDSPFALSIGSLQFIPGFEESLVGKVPNDYAQFELITDGMVMPEDVVYMSYTVFYPDGEAEALKKVRIDLSDPDLDAKYGDGFKNYVLKSPIGSSLTSKTFELDGGSIVYSGVVIDAVTRCENLDNVLTIDARFPDDYSERSLRGLDVKFDVYIRGTNVYECPAFDDKFITETLEIDPETLDSYEGETLTERYRAMIREKLETEEREKLYDKLLEEAVWDHLEAKCTVKKLPKADVQIAYDQYYNEVQYMYAMSGNTFSSIESFAAYYLDLGTNESWLAHIRSRAEYAVKIKLMFYYIVQAENLIPSSEEFDKLYTEQVEEELELYILEKKYDAELDKITDETAKATKRAEYRAEMIREYGEEYFNENVYYAYGLEKILSFAVVE